MAEVRNSYKEKFTVRNTSLSLFMSIISLAYDFHEAQQNCWFVHQSDVSCIFKRLAGVAPDVNHFAYDKYKSHAWQIPLERQYVTAGKT